MSHLPEHDAEKCQRFSDDIMLYFFDVDPDSDFRPVRPKSPGSSGGLVHAGTRRPSLARCDRCLPPWPDYRLVTREGQERCRDHWY
ncbi:hypothetical protein ELH26_15330 [Rhizobium leguminosarum]|uniref:Uncharacterized protein n=1 Tax=Rhizobium beringeri TaxID=3019934 RepID=A0ABY1XWD1_9HYPH|nr:hypothetical protein [Rhizobium leguminosarum bv. viciae]RWX04065.1 hypothetical protein EHI45_33260 [Rhizobium leguminosarum]TBE71932.1 hypothetical protein ELH03_14795 [Rhizobium beringeri]TAU54043.1 hypothetical protein ELI43_15120 [Rhizobium leguminosarum]TBC74077.1 hypothetical protein ELH27_14990 [Rhizobium leguminosarum]